MRSGPARPRISGVSDTPAPDGLADLTLQADADRATRALPDAATAPVGQEPVRGGAARLLEEPLRRMAARPRGARGALLLPALGRGLHHQRHRRRREGPRASAQVPAADRRRGSSPVGRGARRRAWSSRCSGSASAPGSRSPSPRSPAGYLALNLAYSFWLKRIPFVDVAHHRAGLPAAGSRGDLRDPRRPVVLAAGLHGAPGLLPRLRQARARAAQRRAQAPRRQRAVLAGYRLGHLNVALWVLALLTTVAYFLYARAPHTVEFFGTHRMIFTTPFIAIGIWRFIYLVAKPAAGREPDRGDAAGQGVPREHPRLDGGRPGRHLPGPPVACSHPDALDPVRRERSVPDCRTSASGGSRTDGTVASLAP